MKIVHLNDTLARGGTETSILEQLRWFKAHGEDAAICVLSGPIRLGSETNDLADSVINLEAHPRRNFLRCQRRLKAVLRKTQPDVVHTHSFFGLLAVRSAFPFGRPFKTVTTLHNLGYDAWPVRTPYQKARKRLHGRLLRCTDHVTAITKAVAEHYKDQLKVEADTIMPDTVPEAAVRIASERTHNYVIENRYVRLVLPGRIVREKGHSIALEAISRLVKSERGIRLEILGDGPLKAKVASQVSTLGLVDHVEFQSVQGHEAFLRRIAEANICLVPSLHEGLGIVVLEAMQLGVPVIASTAGGLAEIIQDGVSGLAVKPGDAVGLAAACGKLIDDPELRFALARGAREIVQREFSMAEIGPRWLRLYSSLLAEEVH